jgi:ferric-chelate reductase
VSTLTAVAREVSYLQITPMVGQSWVRLPPFGPILLILCYFGFLLALEFTNNNYPGAQHYQAIGVRAAWLAVAQVPLLILLAGKVNIVGLLTGASYERLNVYHRWVARGLLMLASMHFGFQSHGWNLYGLMRLEWDTDTCPPTGITAYAFLLWMNLSTLAPLRNMSYKLFVVQHMITFFGFIITIMRHLPSTALYARVYIWIPIGLFLFDRSVRTLLYLWTNIPPAKARLQVLDGVAVKVRLSSKHVKNWSAGAHVRLRFPRFGFWHTHPARILSSPSSHNGDLVFILKARGWLTRQLLKCAEVSQPEVTSDAASGPTYTTLIGGPYYSPHSDFAAFDTLVLIAGGSGVAFTLSALLHLAHRATKQKFPLQTIEFIWVIRRVDWVSWVAEELQTACNQLHKAGVEIQIQIFVTGDTIPSKADPALEKGATNSDTKIPVFSEGEEGANYAATVHPSLPANYHNGRPDIMTLLAAPIESAKGESAVGVCGPFSLVTAVRTAVVTISDDRAVHKSTGAQGIYLHVTNTDYS